MPHLSWACEQDRDQPVAYFYLNTSVTDCNYVSIILLYILGEDNSADFDNLTNCHFIPRKPTSFNTGDHKPWKQIAIGDHHTIALNEAGL